MTYCVNNKTSMQIGKQGENLARTITISIAPWVEEYGDGEVLAVNKRSQDSVAYPVEVERDGNTVTWKPTEVDTAFAGAGSFQLEYRVDGIVAKTAVWSTITEPSLVGGGDVPEPVPNWIEQMKEVAQQAKDSATESAESAEQSAQSASAAEGFKNDSAQSAQQSAQSATQANNSAQNASESAIQAQQSASKAQQDADSIKELEATATTLPAGSDATADYDAQTGVMSFGIPKGQDGEITYDQWLYCFPNGTATGSIASFPDGADDLPMKSLKVTITPKQAGSGDPSPTNVRPISGWTDADVKQTGVNLWSDVFSEYERPYDYRVHPIALDMGVRYAWSVKRTGQAVSGVVVGFVRGGRKYTEFVGFKILVNASGDIYSGASGNFVTNAGDYPDFSLVIYASTESDFNAFFENYEIQLERADTATEYEPYTGHTTPVPLGQTVYSGKVDVVSGELTINMAMVDMGTLTWSMPATSLFRASMTNAKGSGSESVTANILCSNYQPAQPNASADKTVKLSANGLLLDVKDTAYTDVATFKTAVNGAQLVYELETPITVQLTPSEVRTLLGQNNVWSVGDVAVTYRKDPTLALE